MVDGQLAAPLSDEKAVGGARELNRPDGEAGAGVDAERAQAKD